MLNSKQLDLLKNLLSIGLYEAKKHLKEMEIIHTYHGDGVGNIRYYKEQIELIEKTYVEIEKQENEL